MNNKDKRMDPLVQMFRILGACMVIGTHIKPDILVDGNPVASRTVLACFVGDGVAIFWMILGFFYFRDNDYPQKIKKMIRKILLPMVIFSITMFYLYDFILGVDNTILTSIEHPIEDYIYILKGIITWQSVVQGTGHFWYLYVYVIIVFLFPLLKGLKLYIDQKKDGDIKLLVLLFLLLVWNDMSFNGFFEFSHHTFNGAMGGIVWVFIGSIIYKYKDQFRDKYFSGIIGLVVFVGINLLRAYIQYRCYFLDTPTEEPLFWYTSYAVISVLGLTLFVFGFSKVFEKKYIKIIINNIGKMTFPIYIIHMLVLDLLNKWGMKDYLVRRFGASALGILKYEITYILIIFGISLCLSEIYYFLKMVFTGLIVRVKV